MSKGDLAVGLLVGLVFTGLGAGLTYSHYQATLDSEPLDGVVIDSSVGYQAYDETTGDGPHYYPHVEYRYTVDGDSYTSTNLCPGEGRACTGTTSEADATDLVERFPADEPVTVHVDPADPTTAYLIEADLPLPYLLLLGLGLLISLAQLRKVGSD